MGIEQDIRGLDVPVKEVMNMSVVQCLAEDRDHLGGLGNGKPSATKPGGEVAPIHILGHHVTVAVLGAAHVVDRHDVRMGEPGDDPGFLEVGLNIQEPRRL